jgi:hypothetical protein
MTLRPELRRCHAPRATIESTLSGNYTSTLIVTIIVVIISAATTFYTQRLVKAGNPTQPEGTAATVQKLMAVGIPISGGCRWCRAAPGAGPSLTTCPRSRDAEGVEYECRAWCVV